MLQNKLTQIAGICCGNIIVLVIKSGRMRRMMGCHESLAVKTFTKNAVQPTEVIAMRMRIPRCLTRPSRRNCRSLSTTMPF